MPPIALDRCHHHPGREASARCPQCKRPWCRECVTEHEGRVLCSECLRKSAAETGRSRQVASVLGAGLLALVGVVTAWLFFLALGEMLLKIPDAVHEGSVFHADSEDAGAP